MTRHSFDPLSFVFGAAFVVIAAIGLIDRALMSPADLRWIAPGALVVLGALLLALSARRGGDRDDANRSADTSSSDVDDEMEGARRGTASEESAEDGSDDLQPAAVEDDAPER